MALALDADLGTELLSLVADISDLPLAVSGPLTDELNAALDRDESAGDGGVGLREAVERIRAVLMA